MAFCKSKLAVMAACVAMWSIVGAENLMRVRLPRNTTIEDVQKRWASMANVTRMIPLLPSAGDDEEEFDVVVLVIGEFLDEEEMEKDPDCLGHGRDVEPITFSSPLPAPKALPVPLPQEGSGVGSPMLHTSNRGAGVTIYMIDTGCDDANPVLRDRLEPAFDATHQGAANRDTFEHGTHVGSILAQLTNARIKCVKCGDEQCTNEAMIESMNFVARDVADNNLQGRACCNMSLGGTDRIGVIEEGAQRLVDRFGVPVISASGNGAQDACDVAPGNAPGVITVNSCSDALQASSFSNFGRCSDVYAPGENVLGVLPGNRVGPRWGTSQACPVVTAVVANMLSDNPGMTPAQIKAQLISEAAALVEGVGPGTPCRNVDGRGCLGLLAVPSTH